MINKTSRIAKFFLVISCIIILFYLFLICHNAVVYKGYYYSKQYGVMMGSGIYVIEIDDNGIYEVSQNIKGYIEKKKVADYTYKDSEIEISVRDGNGIPIKSGIYKHLLSGIFINNVKYFVQSNWYWFHPVYWKIHFCKIVDV